MKVIWQSGFWKAAHSTFADKWARRDYIADPYAKEQWAAVSAMVLPWRRSDHDVQVLMGGSRHLEALPGVRRAPVQELGAGDTVLPRDADLPVPVDHKLGVAILER